MKPKINIIWTSKVIKDKKRIKWLQKNVLKLIKEDNLLKKTNISLLKIECHDQNNGPFGKVNSDEIARGEHKILINLLEITKKTSNKKPYKNTSLEALLEQEEIYFEILKEILKIYKHEMGHIIHIQTSPLFNIESKRSIKKLSQSRSHYYSLLGQNNFAFKKIIENNSALTGFLAFCLRGPSTYHEWKSKLIREGIAEAIKEKDNTYTLDQIGLKNQMLYAPLTQITEQEAKWEVILFKIKKTLATNPKNLANIQVPSKNGRRDVLERLFNYYSHGKIVIQTIMLRESNIKKIMKWSTKKTLKEYMKTCTKLKILPAINFNKIDFIEGLFNKKTIEIIKSFPRN